MNCRPSTRKVACPAAMFLISAIVFWTSAVKVTASIVNIGIYNVQPVLPVVFKKTASAISTSAAKSWFAEPNRGHTLL